MTPGGAVTPNSRGVQSRERVLDAAERVMAEDGFEAGTIARVVGESGIPLSSVYHYFGSKEGLLLAVMERGAEMFFAGLPDFGRPGGSALNHLERVVGAAAAALERRPNFLRLLIVFALQPPDTASGEVERMVSQLRELALDRLRRELAAAFGDDPRAPRIDHLAHFALAFFDGAFVASRTDGYSLEQLLEPLAAALVAAHDRLLAS